MVDKLVPRYACSKCNGTGVESAVHEIYSDCQERWIVVNDEQTCTRCRGSGIEPIDIDE